MLTWYAWLIALLVWLDASRSMIVFEVNLSGWRSIWTLLYAASNWFRSILKFGFNPKAANTSKSLRLRDCTAPQDSVLQKKSWVLGSDPHFQQVTWRTEIAMDVRKVMMVRATCTVRSISLDFSILKHEFPICLLWWKIVVNVLRCVINHETSEDVEIEVLQKSAEKINSKLHLEYVHFRQPPKSKDRA